MSEEVKMATIIVLGLLGFVALIFVGDVFTTWAEGTWTQPDPLVCDCTCRSKKR